MTMMIMNFLFQQLINTYHKVCVKMHNGLGFEMEQKDGMQMYEINGVRQS